MSQIPEHILQKIREAKEKQLKELDLGNKSNPTEQKLSFIPPDVFELFCMEKLNLNGNLLTIIPEAIAQLPNLKTLNLGGNQIMAVPQTITQLTQLTSLSLNGNQLTIVPEYLAQLTNLKSLDLGGNQLTSLPDVIGQLSNLTTLGLSGNQLTDVPEGIFQLTHLKTLGLSGNQLTEVPNAIAQLTNLTLLGLSSNRLANVPNAIAQLTNLTSLYLNVNQLTLIPECLAQLVSLTVLILGSNRLTALPESIFQLINLKTLDLSGNQLTVLPEALAQLADLRTLLLGRNQLKVVPKVITQLVNLKRLHLNRNQLMVVPETIAQLTNLEDLNLSHNLLTTAPEWLVQLPNLRNLDLNGNPIETPPPEIIVKGLEATKEYFRQLNTVGKDYLYEAKLLIVGEGGAGKTTLAKKIENVAYILQEDEKSTEGIEVIQCNFLMDNGQLFRVNLWDFGGQEIYHATHQFFLTRRSLYILMADTRKEDTDFYYWLNAVELLSDNSPILIIKNEKQDRQREINERQLRGQFTNLEKILATNLATNRGLPEVLAAIKYYLSRLPHVGTTLPKTWVKVREALENDSRNYISLDEYLAICQQHGFSELKDKLQLSGYLHDLGVCLHFQDDPLLKKTVILKPQWGTAAVYKVLDNKTVINNLGRFTQADLEQIWQEWEYVGMQAELLQLMMKFKLCYSIPNNSDTYIAPQLLTENQPDYQWPGVNNLRLRYSYEFMPKGILIQFIVATHPMIASQKYVWKSGVILKKDEAAAEVIENYGKREITIRVTGKNKKDLLTIITHEMDKIHTSYRRLKYDKLIPCNCAMCKASREPHFYRFEILRKFADEGRRYIQCLETGDMVDVLGLIDDVMDKEKLLQPVTRGDPIESQIESESEIELEKEIFISYAWGGESEKIVNQVDQTFQAKGITIIRDKRDLGFKGRIKTFMEQIGRGKAVVVVISEKYLKSENCMFELVQIAKNGQFYDRIFPIVLDDAKIYRPTDRITYVKYWEAQLKELDKAMKTVSSANLQGFREEIDQYTEIRNAIAELTNIIKDMNTLTPEMHSDSGFEALFKAIERKLVE